MIKEYQTLLHQLEHNHLKIILNRPQKRNALNDLLVKELLNIFENAEEIDEIKSISITGAGSAFCSGADLEHLKKVNASDFQENFNDSKKLGSLYLKIYTFPKPVISVVNGAALAGGCGLATVCDFVLAGKNATFGYPEVKIGFIAAMVSAFLQRQVGERKTRELLLTGQLISAERAFEIGLINKVVDEKQLKCELEDLIQILHKNSSNAMRVTKQLTIDFNFNDVHKEIIRLAEENAKYRQNEDFIEGISSFLEKRKPKWQN